MRLEESTPNSSSSWEPVLEVFFEWLNNRENLFEPGLIPEPTIKILTFLALLDSDKACTYDDIRDIFRKKNVIKGNIPDNTLRTSVLNLGRSLEKAGHHLELKSFRGRFQLINRTNPIRTRNDTKKESIVLLTESPAITDEEMACVLMEKAMLPFHGLYFLEWSARWWETYSGKEAEIRLPYEAGAWEKLGIKNRLSNTDRLIGIVGLAPGEGLAEIELLKKILNDDQYDQVHYLAVDSSPRLLRDHIGLLKETLSQEIEEGRLLCAGVVANIFSELREAIEKAKREFYKCGIIKNESDFLPSSCSLLATYFGNCLGNNYQDQETDFFSMIHSVIQNRPLEVLVGVSIMRSTPDEYKRTWDDFLLQTPRHLLATRKLLKSARPDDSLELPEFILPSESSKNGRCPPVISEPYFVRHQIEGQIYRFYYRLAFDLELVSSSGQHTSIHLPKGTLLLLYNIIKYNIKTLVAGIEKCGVFKIKYDSDYHHILDSPVGTREYVVFSAYLKK